MKIKIIQGIEDVEKARGLVVVIDVLRAFTTVCYLIKNNASKIIPVSSIEDAYKFKKERPDYILIGERNGIVPKSFDYGNSPAEIEKVDFTSKTVILTTTLGTQAITRITNADEIITGSFVNASAIIRYIKKSKYKTLTFVCTNGSDKRNEDYMCAKYLKSCIEGKTTNFRQIKKNLMNHPIAHGFIKKPLTEYAPRDFNLCLQLNRFDFILTVKRLKKNIILEPLPF